MRRAQIRFSSFQGGQNSYTSHHDLSENQAREITNMWLDPVHGLVKRKGYEAEGDPHVSGLDESYGLYEYRKLDKTSEIIHQGTKSGSGANTLKLYDSSTGFSNLNDTVLGDCVLSDYKCNFTTLVVGLKDYMIAVNGSEQIWYDGTNWSYLGQSAPTSAPSVATGGAGTLNGDYRYLVTFIKRDSTESNPSPVSALVSPSSQEVDLTSIPTGGSEVTRRKLYRTTDSGSVYYELYELSDNTTTSYTDDESDDTLGNVLEDDHGVVDEDMEFVASYQGRLFFGNQEGKIQYTLPWEKDYVPSTYYRYIPFEDGEYLTALVSAGSLLIAFSNTGVYALNGSRHHSYRFEKIDYFNVGAPCQGATVRHRNAIYFFNSEGGFKVSKGDIEAMGTPIKDKFASISDYEAIRCNKYQDKIMVCCDDALGDREILIYDLISQGWVVHKDMDVLNAVECLDGALRGAPSDFEVDVYATSPMWVLYEANTDLGEDIQFSLITSLRFTPYPAQRKEYHRLHMIMNRGSDSLSYVMKAEEGSCSGGFTYTPPETGANVYGGAVYGYNTYGAVEGALQTVIIDDPEILVQDMCQYGKGKWFYIDITGVGQSTTPTHIYALMMDAYVYNID